MKRYLVQFAPEAQQQLSALYHHISSVASPNIAINYTNAIVTYCESLQEFPLRGTMREDIRPGLRITNFRKRTIVAFTVNDEVVTVLGIFYGGQNYEADLLRDFSE